MAAKSIFVFFNSYYCRNGYGLSGGDKRAIEVLRRWLPKEKDRIYLAAPGKVGEILEKEHISGYRMLLTSTEKSQDRNLFAAYLIHTRKARRHMSEVCRTAADDGSDCLWYTASDYVTDVLPAAYARKKLGKSKWYAIIHHIIEDYHTRPGGRLHNWLAFMEQQWCIGIIVRHADRILTVSPLVYDYLLQKGVPESRLRLVSNGINVEEMERQKPFKDPDRQFDGIFVARFAESKGIMEFPDIWKRVTDAVPGARLCLVGDGSDETVKKLKAAFAAKGIDHLVTIPGFVRGDELYSWLKSAKVCLFPSHEEGWGIAIAEAMGCGLPVVTYDLPVFSRIFHNINLSGPLGNTEIFARNVISLLQDAEKRERIGKAGKELVEANYTWDKVAEQDWEIIHEEES